MQQLFPAVYSHLEIAIVTAADNPCRNVGTLLAYIGIFAPADA